MILLRHEARRVHRPVDRRPAAVDDHRPHADRFHEHDVEQHVAQGVFVLHHAAAELDDRDLVAKPADPAERLDQRIGLLNGLFQRERFSWTTAERPDQNDAGQARSLPWTNRKP